MTKKARSNFTKLQDSVNRLSNALRDSPTPEVLFKKIVQSVKACFEFFKAGFLYHKTEKIVVGC
jgi:hypothetical protein